MAHVIDAIISLKDNFSTTIQNVTQQATQFRNTIKRTGRDVQKVGKAIENTGAGKQIGMTEAQIMSFSGALSSVGIEAEAGGSSMSKVMIEMNTAVMSGGKELAQFAKVAGVSSGQFANAFKEDASSAMVSFIEGLGRMKGEGANVAEVLEDLGFSEIRVRDALLRASGAGDLFRNSLEIGNKAWKENIALNKEAETRFATTESQIQLVKNHFKLLGDQIGQMFLPYVSKALEKITGLTTRFMNLDEGTKKTIVKFALIAASIGPALLILGKLTGTVGKAIFAWGKFLSAVKKAGSVWAVIASPANLIVLAILAVVAGAVLLIKHWDKVKKVATDLGKKFKEFAGITDEQVEFVKGVFKRLKDSVKDAFKEVVEAFKPLKKDFQDLGKQLYDVFQQLKPILMPILGFIAGVFVTQIVFNFMKMVHTIKAVVGMVAGIIGGIIDIIKGNLMIFEGVITGDMDKIVEGMKTVWRGLGNTLKSIWQGAVDILTAPVDAVVDILDATFKDKVAGLKEMWNGLKEFLRNPIKGTVNLFKRESNSKGKVDGSHYSGLARVPFDGYIAELHKDETVLPRREAEAYRQGKTLKNNPTRVQNKVGNTKQETGKIEINIPKLAEQIIVREDTDIDKIARALVREIEKANLNMA